MTVRLLRLDGPLLDELAGVAVTRADPAEVMPPVAEDPDPPEAGWTELRRAAFTAFHREQSLRPHAPQTTYAITVGGRRRPAAGVDGSSPDEQVVGAARLAAVAGEPGTVEAGLWIARDHRGRGVGRAVLRELRDAARVRGARRLLARTSVDNGPARRLLTEEYGPAAPDPQDPGTLTVRFALSPVAELLLGSPPMNAELPALDPETAPSSPGTLFASWLDEAVAEATPDVAVATLATVDPDGFPDARVLLLRDVDPDGGAWTFASESTSPKGRQLAACPAAALTLYWGRLGRQVRVRGSVGERGREIAAADFHSRSAPSRLAGLIGHQSQPLASLAEYDRAAQEARERLAREPDRVPPGHTVYTLYAREVEFWQGSVTRRHVRLHYTRSAPSEWRTELRWP